GLDETYCTDHWRCRFVSWASPWANQEQNYAPVDFEQVVALLSTLNHMGYDVIKTENLYKFNNKPGFSLGQGE
ncbi:MAG: NADP-dependent isocitrate dehydrogenase, partial [Luteibaculum sp.]